MNPQLKINMKAFLTRHSTAKPCAWAVVVLLSSALPSFAQTNSAMRPLNPIKFSTAPLQLRSSVQAGAHSVLPRSESASGMIFVPITFGTALIAVLAWEPAHGPALNNASSTPLTTTNALNRSAASQNDLGSEPGALRTFNEPSVRQIQLQPRRPRFSFGSDVAAHMPRTERPPGWVFLSVRF